MEIEHPPIKGADGEGGPRDAGGRDNWVQHASPSSTWDQSTAKYL